MDDEAAHRFAREHGVNRALYELVRLVLLPLVKVWYRFGVTGAEHVPPDGPVIVAPNHKSFYDAFFVGLACRRPLQFMAKTELLHGRSARLLNRLGAFPVKRGTADPEALESARLLLEQGRALVLFPEGTRFRDPDALKTPHRGAGRLAIEAQAPIVPCAITGTERLFAAGWFPKPVRVQVAFAQAVTPAQLEATPQAAAELIEDRVWPQVEREYHRLRARPGLIAAGLAALGLGGGLAYRAQRPPKRRVLPGRRRRRGSRNPLRRR
jgi:1-acyl-sn-glycerol-3-phosphate acyltransferase